MLKFSEFTNGIEEALSDWTHKLGFNDLTPVSYTHLDVYKRQNIFC